MKLIHGTVDEQGAKIADVSLVQLAMIATSKEVVSTGVVTSPTYSELR